MIGRTEKNGPQGNGINKDVSFTLNTVDRHAVFSEDKKTYAARMGTGGGNVAVLNEADRQETDEVRTVRRLTVTECERAQGLPDGYTDVPINGKPASDSERLKAIGNGMAQPCADFVLKQIVKFQSVR